MEQVCQEEWAGFATLSSQLQLSNSLVLDAFAPSGWSLAPDTTAQGTGRLKLFSSLRWACVDDSPDETPWSVDLRFMRSSESLKSEKSANEQNLDDRLLCYE
jgi:hypothetical protein